MTLEWTLAGIEAAGFIQCGNVSALQVLNCSEIPDLPGVYLVYRLATGAPSFLTKSSGGHFKGKDPTVAVATLLGEWVDQASVLYVGKAGTSLRARIRQYLRFGKGCPVGHWGGRYIWQMADHGDLLLLCRTMPAKEASGCEAKLIESFGASHGGLYPFANLLGYGVNPRSTEKASHPTQPA